MPGTRFESRAFSLPRWVGEVRGRQGQPARTAAKVRPPVADRVLLGSPTVPGFHRSTAPAAMRATSGRTARPPGLEAGSGAKLVGGQGAGEFQLPRRIPVAGADWCLLCVLRLTSTTLGGTVPHHSRSWIARMRHAMQPIANSPDALSPSDVPPGWNGDHSVQAVPLCCFRQGPEESRGCAARIAAVG